MRDVVEIKVRSGAGGDGGRYFSRDRKPHGGDGGKGGDVILIGDRNFYDLSKLVNRPTLTAGDGKPGSEFRVRGVKGEDLIIKVPLTTEVIADGIKVTSISEHGQEYVVCKGGIAGFGNHYFRDGKFQTATHKYAGSAGKEVKLKLELHLTADIIFIGFPNAGKSSMLNALTNANVKVAAYPFTTISPNLAVAKGMLLMDLPGLIEGTFEGKGLGTGFTKHTENAKLLAHFLSLESDDLLSEYNKMRSELDSIGKGLAQLKEVLIFTKSDLFKKEEIESKIAPLKTLGKEYIITSSFDYTEIDEVTNFLRKELV